MTRLKRGTYRLKRFYSFINTIGVVKVFIFCFFGGILIGTVVANVFRGFYINDFFLFQDSYYNALKVKEIDCFSVFTLSLISNIKSFALLILLATTMIGIPGYMLHIGYKGFSVGFLISTAVMRFGIGGVVFFLGYLFPHYLVLIPLYLIVYMKGFHLNERLYSKNESNRVRFMSYMPSILLLLVLLFIASLLEGYFNTGLLQQIMLNLR